MNQPTPSIKLEAVIRFDEDVSYSDYYHNFIIYNFGRINIDIVELGEYADGGGSKKILTRFSPTPLSIRPGEEYSLYNDGKANYRKDKALYLKTASGAIISSGRVPGRIKRRMAIMRLSKRLNPWHKTLPHAASMAILTLVTLMILSLLTWVVIITNDRATYEAIGSITLSPANDTSKHYTLKVGGLDEAAKNGGVTDTIYVGNSASHWYSIFNHKEYTVTNATWTNGQELTLYDYVFDRVDHKVYEVVPGCDISSRYAKAYCIGSDNKAYYVSIETVGPDIVDQLNGT